MNPESSSGSIAKSTKSNKSLSDIDIYPNINDEPSVILRELTTELKNKDEVPDELKSRIGQAVTHSCNEINADIAHGNSVGFFRAYEVGGLVNLMKVKLTKKNGNRRSWKDYKEWKVQMVDRYAVEALKEEKAVLDKTTYEDRLAKLKMSRNRQLNKCSNLAS